MTRCLSQQTLLYKSFIRSIEEARNITSAASVLSRPEERQSLSDGSKRVTNMEILKINSVLAKPVLG